MVRREFRGCEVACAFFVLQHACVIILALLLNMFVFIDFERGAFLIAFHVALAVLMA